MVWYGASPGWGLCPWSATRQTSQLAKEILNSGVGRPIFVAASGKRFYYGRQYASFRPSPTIGVYGWLSQQQLGVFTRLLLHLVFMGGGVWLQNLPAQPAIFTKGDGPQQPLSVRSPNKNIIRAQVDNRYFLRRSESTVQYSLRSGNTL